MEHEGGHWHSGVQEWVAGVPSARSVELVIVQPSKSVRVGQEDAFQEFVRGGC